MGAASNLEGFAKSVFDQRALNRFNSINTKWLVVYFFLLTYLVRFGLMGVFTSLLIFYSMRCGIALWVVQSVDAGFDGKKIGGALLPGAVEFGSFLGAATCCGVVMKGMEERRMVGFLVCVFISLIHLALFIYFKMEKLLEFKRIIRG